MIRRRWAENEVISQVLVVGHRVAAGSRAGRCLPLIKDWWSSNQHLWWPPPWSWWWSKMKRRRLRWNTTTPPSACVSIHPADGIKEVPGNISSTGLAKNAKTAKRLQKVAWQVHWSYRCICPPNSSPCGGVIVSSQAGQPSRPPHILTTNPCTWTEHTNYIYLYPIVYSVVCWYTTLELMQKGCCPA